MKTTKPSKYWKKIQTDDEGRVDVYRILKAFDPIPHPVAHAIKKLLAPGARGAKDSVTDVQEAIDSLNCWLESERETKRLTEVEFPPCLQGACYDCEYLEPAEGGRCCCSTEPTDKPGRTWEFGAVCNSRKPREE
jgi:hypothetical protein